MQCAYDKILTHTQTHIHIHTHKHTYTYTHVHINDFIDIYYHSLLLRFISIFYCIHIV